jgi:Tfp pilus assembly protein PilV
MPRIPSRPAPSRLAHRLREDDGFGLIEVMTSAVLLLVLAMGTMKLLDTSQAASSMNRSRDVAATLAQADQESMRQLPLSQIAGGYHPGDRQKTMGDIPYTISSSGDWTRDATGEVACSAAATTAGRGEYLTITSTVTWPGMAATKSKPVVFQSIVAPGVEAFGAGKGALAIKLKRANGTGASGITVASGSVSGMTDSDGCVVLNNLSAGDTTVGWNQSGWVDPDGVQPISKDETIGDGTTAQDAGAYDQAGRLNVGFTDDVSPTPQTAKWPSFSVVQTGMTGSNGVRTFPKTPGSPAASLTTDYSLYPFTSAYTVYAGSCAGNNPAAYSPPAAFSGYSALLTPGSDANLAMQMRTVVVTVKDSSNALKANATVQALPYTADSHMTGCTERTVRGTFKTDSTGTVRIPLPYGLYSFCAQAPNGSQYNTGTSTGFAANTEDLAGTYQRNAVGAVKLGSGTTSTQCPS